MVLTDELDDLVDEQPITAPPTLSAATVKSRDLAARGIDYYTKPSGEPAESADWMGSAQSSPSPRSRLPRDSGGEPVADWMPAPVASPAPAFAPQTFEQDIPRKRESLFAYDERTAGEQEDFDWQQKQLAKEAEKQRRATNTQTARQLRAAAIPSVEDASGNIQPVRDSTGAPLTGHDRRHNIAYDSAGSPVEMRLNPETFAVETRPAAASAKRVTDKKGDVYQVREGLPWQWQGEDAATKEQLAAKERETLDAQAATALGGPIAASRSRFAEVRGVAKASAKQLAQLMAQIGVSTDAAATPEELRDHIETAFNAEYAAPDANRAPFWGGGRYTPEAQTLRDDIGRRKKQAFEALNGHAATMEDYHAAKDELTELMRQRNELRSGKLAAVNARREAAGMEPVGAIPGLDPARNGPAIPGIGGTNIPRGTGEQDLVGVATEESNTSGGTVEPVIEAAPANAIPGIEAPGTNASSLYDRAKNFLGSIIGGAASATGEIMRSPVGKFSEMVGGYPIVAELLTGHAPGSISQATGEALAKVPGIVTDPAFTENGEAKAGRFIGGVAPYIAAGAIAPEAVIPALFGSGFQGQYEAAKEHGADEETANTAGIIGGAVNAVLGIPLGGAGKTVAGLFGKAEVATVRAAMDAAYARGGAPAVAAELEALKAAISRAGVAADVPSALKEAVAGGLDGVIKEINMTAGQRVARAGVNALQRGVRDAALFAGTQAAQNVTARLYNPEQPIGEGVGEAVLGGAVLGAFFGGVEEIGRARKAGKAREEIASGIAKQARGGEPGEPPAPPEPPKMGGPPVPKGPIPGIPTQPTEPTPTAEPILTTRQRHRKLLEGLLENDESDEGIGKAYAGAGYVNIDGFWVHPDVDPEWVGQLSQQTKQRLKEGGIFFIDPESEAAGRVGIMQVGGRKLRGIGVKTERGEASQFTLKDQHALHELGHHIWADELTDEQRAAFAAHGIRTQHGRDVASGEGRGESYKKAAGIYEHGVVAEEDFAQHFAENEGDLQKTLAEPTPTEKPNAQQITKTTQPHANVLEPEGTSGGERPVSTEKGGEGVRPSGQAPQVTPDPVAPEIELSAREKELAALDPKAPPWQRDLIAGRIRELRAMIEQQSAIPDLPAVPTPERPRVPLPPIPAHEESPVAPATAEAPAASAQPAQAAPKATKPAAPDVSRSRVELAPHVEDALEAAEQRAEAGDEMGARNALNRVFEHMPNEDEANPDPEQFTDAEWKARRAENIARADEMRRRVKAVQDKLAGSEKSTDGEWKGGSVGENPVIAFRLNDGRIMIDPSARIHATAIQNLGLGFSGKLEPGFVIGDKFIAGSQTNPKALAEVRAEQARLKQKVASPHDFTPALVIGGETVTGQKGDSHEDIYNRFMREHGANEAKHEAAVAALADDNAHVFVDASGKVHTREQVSEALGEKKPMQSERLRFLQGPKKEAAPEEPAKSVIPGVPLAKPPVPREEKPSVPSPTHEPPTPPKAAPARGADVEKTRRIVQAALNTQRAQLAALEHPHELLEHTAKPDESGIKTIETPSGPRISVDYGQLHRKTVGTPKQGRTISRMVAEEVVHVATLKWAGESAANRAKLIALGQDAETAAQMREAYGAAWDRFSDYQKGAEAARAFVQGPRKLTEAAYKFLKDFLKWLDAKLKNLTPQMREIVDGIRAKMSAHEKGRPAIPGMEIEPKTPRTKAQELGDQLFEGLFAAAPEMEQRGFPREKRALAEKLADALVEDRIATPKALAQWLEKSYGGKARVYSQALWNALATIEPKMTGVHPWDEIYGGLEKPEASLAEQIKTIAAGAEERKAAERFEKSPDTSPAKMKAQKAYLIDALDKAIEEAPDEISDAARGKSAAWNDSKQIEDTRGRIGKELEEEGKINRYSPAFDAEVNKRVADEHAAMLDQYGIESGTPAYAAPKSVAGTEVVPSVAAKEFTPRQRLDLLEKKLRTEIARHNSITIEVPGDGTFSIVNTKDNLREFRKKAQKFPVRTLGPDEPVSTASNPTAIPGLKKPNTAADMVRAAGIAISDDETREVLNYVFSNGKEIVGTDGRRLILIEGKAGGTEKAPVFLTADAKTYTPPKTYKDEKGKDQPYEFKYPNFRQVIPELKTYQVSATADTGSLFRKLAQARRILTEKASSVRLWSDKGETGITAFSGEENLKETGWAGGEYSSGVNEDTARFLGNYNAQYLMDAVKMARALGHEKIEFLTRTEQPGDSTAERDPSFHPLLIRAKGMTQVIMPLRGEGAMQKFGEFIAGLAPKAKSEAPKTTYMHGKKPEPAKDELANVRSDAIQHLERADWLTNAQRGGFEFRVKKATTEDEIGKARAEVDALKPVFDRKGPPRSINFNDITLVRQLSLSERQKIAEPVIAALKTLSSVSGDDKAGIAIRGKSAYGDVLKDRFTPEQLAAARVVLTENGASQQVIDEIESAVGHWPEPKKTESLPEIVMKFEPGAKVRAKKEGDFEREGVITAPGPFKRGEEPTYFVKTALIESVYRESELTAAEEERLEPNYAISFKNLARIEALDKEWKAAIGFQREAERKVEALSRAPRPKGHEAFNKRHDKIESLRRDAERMEKEANKAQDRLQSFKMDHQVESFDYYERIIRGHELPPDRLKLYPDAPKPSAPEQPKSLADAPPERHVTAPVVPVRANRLEELRTIVKTRPFTPEERAEYFQLSKPAKPNESDTRKDTLGIPAIEPEGNQGQKRPLPNELQREGNTKGEGVIREGDTVPAPSSLAAKPGQAEGNQLGAPKAGSGGEQPPMGVGGEEESGRIANDLKGQQGVGRLPESESRAEANTRILAAWKKIALPHSELLQSAGYSIVEGPHVGGGGISTSIYRHKIEINPERLAETTRLVEAQGGDVEKWAAGTMRHETIHVAQVAVRGIRTQLVYTLLTNSLTDDILRMYADYGGATDRSIIASEHVARLVQYRMTGEIAEEHSGKYSKAEIAGIKAELERPQPEAIEREAGLIQRFIETGEKPVREPGTGWDAMLGAPSVTKPGEELHAAAPVKFSFKDAYDKVAETVQQAKQELKASGAKEHIVSGYDAGSNIANNKGEQARTSIRLDLPEAKDREAMPFVIEAGDDPAELQTFKQQIARSSDPKLAAKYGTVIDHAIADFARLNAKKANHDAIMADSLTRLRAADVDVGEVENYVTRKLDAPENAAALLPNPLFSIGTGQGSNPRYFTKGRAFATLADAIENGYRPKGTDLADLDGHRIAAGERILEQKRYINELKATPSPTDGKPIIGEMQQRTTLSGKVEQTVPRGYRMVQVAGRPVVVHGQFADTFQNLFGTSAVRATIIGRGLMKMAAVAKSYTLVFDTFHVGRLLFKMAASGHEGPVTMRGGKPGWNIHKGLSVLEYKDSDLARGVAAGEITAEEAAYARRVRPMVDELLRAGLNAGRVADNLMEQAKIHLPVVGKLNDWIFQKLSRGAMLQTSIKAYQRNLRLPGITRKQAARQTAKEMNELFGNLQNQGLFTSKTLQDVARLFFLAPQWTESQFRYEGRAYAQAGKGAWRFVRSGGRERQLGNSFMALAAGFVGLLAVNQIINFLTRGKSTFQNDEDGHLLDAWIPGGKRGFFLNPAEIAAEYAHAAFKYAAQHEHPVDIATHIASNKLSPGARGLKDIATGRDYSGRHYLTNTDRFRAGIVDALPSPIPMSAVLEKDPRQPLGYRINRRGGGVIPGLEKQFLQSGGAKVTEAQSPRSAMFALAQPFRADRGRTDVAGEYTELRRALDLDETDAAKTEIQWLLGRGKTMDMISHAMGVRKGGSVAPEIFAGSADREREMLKSLSPAEHAVYAKAQREHFENAMKFLKISRTAPMSPAKPIIKAPRHAPGASAFAF